MVFHYHMDTMQLGGNIELVNFHSLEPGKLIVVKKIVGRYAKEIGEKNPSFQKLKVVLKENNEIEATLSANENNYTESDSNQNLFFSLDKALSKLNKQF